MINKISMIMRILIVFTLMICLFSNVVYANDISFTYDFEIDALDSKWVSYTGRPNYSLVDSETERGTVLQMDRFGAPNLMFGKLVNTGILYISFDYQHNFQTGTMAVYLGKAANTDLTQITSANNYCRTLFFNDGDKTDDRVSITYFDRGSGNDMMSTWTKTDPNVSVGYGEWHNYKIVIRDIEESTAYADYYIDDELINVDDPIKCYGAGGFMALNFWPDNVTAGDKNIGRVDNLVVKNFSSEPEIKLTLGDNKVNEQDGVLTVSLDTPVNKDLLTEENVLIKNVNTGEKVDNFTLSDVTESGFKVNFVGEIARGKYYLTLADVVKVPILESTVKTGVEFRTAWKSQNVNGVDVVIPDLNEILFYDINGDVLENLDNVSSFVSKIEVVFNTLVDEDTAKNNITLKGKATGITTSLVNMQNEDNEEYSVYSLNLEHFLNADTDYELSIDAGIASGIESVVLSENEYNETFTTLDDAAFITDKGVWNGSEYTVSFSKNIDDELKFSVLLCGYKTVSVDGVNYEQLVGSEYIPIYAQSNEKGIFSYTKQIGFKEQSEYVKVYFWKYPSMNSISIDDSGILK